MDYMGLLINVIIIGYVLGFIIVKGYSSMGLVSRLCGLWVIGDRVS